VLLSTVLLVAGCSAYVTPAPYTAACKTKKAAREGGFKKKSMKQKIVISGAS
jgi:hypothetical protein